MIKSYIGFITISFLVIFSTIMIFNLRNTALYKKNMDSVEDKEQIIILSNDLNKILEVNLKQKFKQNIKKIFFSYKDFDFMLILDYELNNKIVSIDSRVSYKNISHNQKNIYLY